MHRRTSRSYRARNPIHGHAPWPWGVAHACEEFVVNVGIIFGVGVCVAGKERDLIDSWHIYMPIATSISDHAWVSNEHNINC
jgi:hypothetical protein